MLMLENYKITQSDALNFRIEELRDVTNKDTQIVSKKWTKNPNYYNSLIHSLESLLKGEFVNKLLPKEETSINELLSIVKNKFDDLKIEIEK